MAETITLRPLFGKVLAIATGVVIVVCLVTLIVDGDPAAGIRFALPLVTVGYLVWLTFWLPAVEISDGGVRLHNTLRTIDLPWPSIERIDTRYALTLYTTYGRFVAWAAPASGRHTLMSTPASDTKHLPESTFMAGSIGAGDVPRTDSGDAAAIIRRRWEALRDAGHLDRRASDPDHTAVHWHRVQIVVLALLVVLSALGLLLG
ncbi:PH domain-containing protein [Glaciibacter psychrotolerans]|uniref:Low molecular weight protein antigen 6 PH domain-containing protein n=1 Tax=Glaciibacter psychrotolerans TaxID=670054 RepID=A0A7Z0EDR4_9MICO|nr:PH domain-containing protein [Leifsonia psychrotolerans]NYJ19758.1 hypothetical protein [Leifsonia psychrotolerans]